MVVGKQYLLSGCALKMNWITGNHLNSFPIRVYETDDSQITQVPRQHDSAR